MQQGFRLGGEDGQDAVRIERRRRHGRGRDRARPREDQTGAERARRVRPDVDDGIVRTLRQVQVETLVVVVEVLRRPGEGEPNRVDQMLTPGGESVPGEVRFGQDQVHLLGLGDVDRRLTRSVLQIEEVQPRQRLHLLERSQEQQPVHRVGYSGAVEVPCLQEVRVGRQYRRGVRFRVRDVTGQTVRAGQGRPHLEAEGPAGSGSHQLGDGGLDQRGRRHRRAIHFHGHRDEPLTQHQVRHAVVVPCFLHVGGVGVVVQRHDVVEDECGQGPEFLREVVHTPQQLLGDLGGGIVRLVYPCAVNGVVVADHFREERAADRPGEHGSEAGNQRRGGVLGFGQVILGRRRIVDLGGVHKLAPDRGRGRDGGQGDAPNRPTVSFNNRS